MAPESEEKHEQQHGPMLTVQIPNEMAYAALLAGGYTVRCIDAGTYTLRQTPLWRQISR